MVQGVPEDGTIPSDEALAKLYERLQGEWIWQEVINKKPPELTEEQVGELGRSLGRMLERIEEAVAPERVELIESIRQKDTLIGELASEKRGLEEELARYKQKEKKRERYQRRMQKPQSQKTKRKKPR